MTRPAIADPSGAEPAIEAESLVKRYGETVAVAGVSFAVARGEIFGYLGRNGSGKTTTVRMLTTLTRPSSGTARVAGIDVADARRVRERIGVTMQDAALDEAMTGAEHLRFVAGLSGATRTAARARADELLELVGLDAVAGARIATYSGGMKRRLDIASALVGQPSVLFLDEPTTGLDPQSRRAVWDEIRSLQASGVTVFLTTQYIEEAEQLADRIAIVDAGVIIAEGPPQALKAAHGHTTIAFEHDGDIARVRSALGGTDGAPRLDAAPDPDLGGVEVRRDARVRAALGDTDGVPRLGAAPGPGLDDVEVRLDARGRTVVSLDTAASGDDDAGEPGARGDTSAVRVLDRLRAAGVTPMNLTISETSLEDVFVRLTGSDINSPTATTTTNGEEGR